MLENSQPHNRKPILPEKLTAAIKRRTQQAYGIAICIAAVTYTATLVSYRAGDNAFNHSSTNPTRNWLGPPGAYSADISLQLFGIAAYALALIVFIWGVLYIRERTFRNIKKRLILLPITLIACALAATASASLFTAETTFPTTAGVGGIIGQIAQFQWLSPLAQWLQENLQNLMPTHILMAIANILQSQYTQGALGGIVIVTGGALLVYETALNRREFYRIAHFILKPLTIALRTKPTKINSAKTPLTSRSKTPTKTIKPATKTAHHDKRKQYDLLKQTDSTPLPPPELLSATANEHAPPPEDTETLQQNARMLEAVLQDFGVKGEITQVSPGPVVTQYELQPAPGTKTSRVVSLSDDIARSMSALSVRIATIPGRNVIGIELPNRQRAHLILRDLLEADSFRNSKAKLPLVLGKNIGGDPQIADLAAMPHLLIAGTTGSGKSVGLNAMILSLLYRYSAKECRLIMIDPKMLELSVYDNIPHLLTPVVTEPKKALVALRWAVKEMEERYRAMAYLSVRNIDGYNARVREALAEGETLSRRVQTGFDSGGGQPVYEEQALDLRIFPYIVVVVDEMADLMLVAGKEIESYIQRLAQMARAAGIHLIMATQRPSVDVITGTIKANFPTRISFMVTSKIDSRTILGEQGAEQLLGRGDMLFMEGGGRITRIHGPFVDDSEVEAVCNFLRNLGEPEYVAAVLQEEDEADVFAAASDSGEADILYEQAVEVVVREGKASTSFIQRHLQIGYNRAARIMDLMEKRGIVSAANHAGKREILTDG